MSPQTWVWTWLMQLGLAAVCRWPAAAGLSPPAGVSAGLFCHLKPRLAPARTGRQNDPNWLDQLLHKNS